MTTKDPVIQLNSESDRNAIRAQLDRILSDPLFLNSKRYPSFLRYVVTRTLEGQAEQLKERTLGMEVFGREPDYDTNLDNVVRSTAGEIRKRLAQYYQDPQHTNEIRIDLPSGSYVPKFHHHVKEPAPVPVPSVQPRLFPRWTFPVIAALVIAVALYAWTKVRGPETAMEKFWAPLLHAQGSVLLCTGTVQSLARQMAGVKSAEVSTVPNDLRRHVTLAEATALMKFSSLLNARGKAYRLRDDSSITLADLKDAPVILIGAMNNIWTLRIVAPLQFSIQFDTDSNTVWIADRAHQSRRNWSKNNAVPPDKITEDYALISRFQDPTTGQYAVVSAGLYRYGTVAAAEFLNDPSLLAELDSLAPRGWEHQNLQVVIATKVIDGNATRPRILAIYFW
jgi:hypothetical protein